MSTGCYAKFLGGDYQAAIQLSHGATRQRSDFVGAHRVLAASAGMAGDVDLAGAALAECRRVQPNISLDWIRREMPIKLEPDRARYLEGLRRAGLT